MGLTFVDTDALIRIAKGDSRALAALAKAAAPNSWATTSVNVAEFLRGIPPTAATHEAALFLEAFQEVPFGPRAARKFGQLMHALDRSGKRIPAADGLIAATVLAEDGVLLTGNTKDFSRVAGLVVLKA